MTQKDRTIIIGAGVAGLSAAEELQKAGREYIILEGRDRIGGRVHTLDWPATDPTQFELGAAWFHDVPHNPLARKAEEAGFPSLFDDEKTVIYDTKGKLDQAVVKQVWGNFDEYRRKRDASENMESVLDAYAQICHNEQTRRAAYAIAYMYQLFAGVKPTEISAHAEPPRGRDKAVQGGYIRTIIDVVAKDVDREKIQYNKKVTHVLSLKNGEGVQVTTQDGEHYQGGSLIVTAPIGVLKKGNIQFEPPLNHPIQEALKKTHVAHIEKVYLTFNEAFWDTSVFKFVVSDQATPSLIWNWGAAHPEANQNKTLAVLVTNDMAFELQKHPKHAFELVKPLLQVVAKDGTQVPDPVQIVHSSWVTDELSEGSFSAVPKGVTREELARPFIEGEAHNHIFFAGEHATVEGASLVQGAWMSGQRAAEQILRQ